MCVRQTKEVKFNHKKEEVLLSISSFVTTKYFTAALLSFSLAETFGEILEKKRPKKKKRKKVRGERGCSFSPKSRESVRGTRGTRGTQNSCVGLPCSPTASLPIPRVPPNVVGMDEGSRTKDERKKKSVRKARGDRSITNHYGPSGTAKRTLTTIRRVFLFRNARLYSRVISPR